MSSTDVVQKNALATYAVSGQPSQNYAGLRRLHVSSTRHTFISFNRAFPAKRRGESVTIVSATLRLFARDGGWGAQTINVHRLGFEWKKNRLNWNNRPAVVAGGAVASKTQNTPNDGTVWEFDVRAQMQAVADGGVWYGFSVRSEGADTLSFYSPDVTTYQPQLEIEWSERPEQPTVLSPSGNRAVSIAKPVLTFDFTDAFGNTAMAGAQVQLNALDEWGAPLFDSGTVLTSERELDLATTAYAGLAGGASIYWRVRVLDGSGLWSPWSDAARFKRIGHGVLTLSNPPDIAVPFVSEWTPPIVWQFTGAQTGYRVLITRADDPSVHLADSGRVRSTETQWTVPRRTLRDDREYRVVLTVWDDIDREQTPGAPAFVRVARTFVFQEDGTPNPVTALTATQVDGSPWVDIEWDRATAADYYVVKRNGTVVEDFLEPSEVLAQGTHYSFRDQGAKPHDVTTYVVQAVVNGKTSTNNPSVNITVRPIGIWLVDAVRKVYVMINSEGPGEWSVSERYASYFPVNSTREIRVVESIGGYVGSISGTLTNTPSLDMTANKLRERLIGMKERPENVLQLIAGRTSIRVLVSDIVVSPADDYRDAMVSFRFMQVGQPEWEVRL